MKGETKCIYSRTWFKAEVHVYHRLKKNNNLWYYEHFIFHHSAVNYYVSSNLANFSIIPVYILSEEPSWS